MALKPCPECDPMSEMGQSLPKWAIRATSAFPPIATIERTSRRVSNVQKRKLAGLFDDLFGHSDHRRWKTKPKRFGCLEVDAHHIPVRLFYGDFAGVRTLQDFIDQACALASQNTQIRTKTYQSTFSYSLSEPMTGRQSLRQRKGGNRGVVRVSE
jgi:hypothetical protein